MGTKVKSGGGAIDVLIIARPSRFQDGLKVIIQALDWVRQTGLMTEWTAVPDYIQRYQPALVIYDVNDLGSMTWVEAKSLSLSCEKTKCIAIIDRAQQRELADVLGADAILLRGFTTELLYSTMRTLVVAYDPAVPVTRPLSLLQT